MAVCGVLEAGQIKGTSRRSADRNKLRSDTAKRTRTLRSPVLYHRDSYYHMGTGFSTAPVSYEDVRRGVFHGAEFDGGRAQCDVRDLSRNVFDVKGTR